jgi:hypothetical protein
MVKPGRNNVRDGQGPKTPGMALARFGYLGSGAGQSCHSEAIKGVLMAFLWLVGKRVNLIFGAGAWTGSELMTEAHGYPLNNVLRK